MAADGRMFKAKFPARSEAMSGFIVFQLLNSVAGDGRLEEEMSEPERLYMYLRLRRSDLYSHRKRSDKSTINLRRASVTS